MSCCWKRMIETRHMCSAIDSFWDFFSIKRFCSICYRIKEKIMIAYMIEGWKSLKVKQHILKINGMDLHEYVTHAVVKGFAPDLFNHEQEAERHGFPWSIFQPHVLSTPFCNFCVINLDLQMAMLSQIFWRLFMMYLNH